MSIESILSVPAVAPDGPAASRVQRRPVRRARLAAWGHFNNDRRLIRLKLVLLGLLFIAAMALEVPL